MHWQMTWRKMMTTQMITTVTNPITNISHTELELLEATTIQHRHSFLPSDAILVRYVLSLCAVRLSVCTPQVGVLPNGQMQDYANNAEQ